MYFFSIIKGDVQTEPKLAKTVNADMYGLMLYVYAYLSPGKGKSPDADSGAIINSTEDEQLQEMGKPRLGELVRIKINIKESQEFKVKLCFNL